MPVLHSTTDTFQSDVLDKKGLVFVDFFAEWCGPCKMVAPHIEELAKEMSDVTFVKVDVEKNEEISSQYSIFSIPTFVLFRDGKVVSQVSGAMQKDGLKEFIKKEIKG